MKHFLVSLRKLSRPSVLSLLELGVRRDMALFNYQFSLLLVLFLILNIADNPKLFHVCCEVQNFRVRVLLLTFDPLRAYLDGTLLHEERAHLRLLLGQDRRL